MISKIAETGVPALNRISLLTFVKSIVEYDLIRMGLEQESFVVTFVYTDSCWPLFESASADDVVVLVLDDVQSWLFAAHQLPELFIGETLFGGAVNKPQ